MWAQAQVAEGAQKLEEAAREAAAMREQQALDFERIAKLDEETQRLQVCLLILLKFFRKIEGFICYRAEGRVQLMLLPCRCTYSTFMSCHLSPMHFSTATALDLQHARACFRQLHAAFASMPCWQAVCQLFFCSLDCDTYQHVQDLLEEAETQVPSDSGRVQELEAQLVKAGEQLTEALRQLSEANQAEDAASAVHQASSQAAAAQISELQAQVSFHLVLP